MMLQFTDEQKHEILSLLQQNRKVEAVKIVKESSHLGLKEAKDFVENLIENPQDLNEFVHNTQTDQIKTETQNFEYNFSSRKIKFTDNNGKTVEIDDQHPEWHKIEQQFNIDLSQPDALKNFVKQFNQNHDGNKSQADDQPSQGSEFTQHNTSPVPNSGIENLGQKNHFGRVILLMAIIFLIGIAYVYFQKN